MSSPDAIRVSDAERDQVLDRLRDALVEGRLNSSEFDERTSATLASRTVGQLRAVTADLPPGPSRPLVRHVGQAVPARTGGPRVLGLFSWGWFPIFAACTLIWLIGGHGGPFWPAWLLVWAAFSFRGRHHGSRNRPHRHQPCDRQEQERERQRLGR